MVTPANKITRRRWTDAAIESELRTLTATLQHFPTRSELAARGLRGLWDAMRASGGVDAWRERVLTAPSGPSREQIANRAYELYERGSPGSPEEHWLAAERELTAEPAG